MSDRNYKSPKALTDALLAVQTERLLLQRQVDVLKAREDRLLTQARDLLKSKDLAQYALPNGVEIRRVTKPVATIGDWKRVVTEALKLGHLEVIHKRVSPTQLEKLAREGVHIGGVELGLQEHGALYVPKKVKDEAKKGAN